MPSQIKILSSILYIVIEFLMANCFNIVLSIIKFQYNVSFYCCLFSVFPRKKRKENAIHYKRRKKYIEKREKKIIRKNGEKITTEWNVAISLPKICSIDV